MQRESLILNIGMGTADDDPIAACQCDPVETPIMSSYTAKAYRLTFVVDLTAGRSLQEKALASKSDFRNIIDAQQSLTSSEPRCYGLEFLNAFTQIRQK